MPIGTDERVEGLEAELSLLKNQVQQTLLDIREHVLEFTSPMAAEARMVRAWHDRTAEAAELNLGGPGITNGGDVEQLLESAELEADVPLQSEADPDALEVGDDVSAAALVEEIREPEIPDLDPGGAETGPGDFEESDSIEVETASGATDDWDEEATPGAEAPPTMAPEPKPEHEPRPVVAPEPKPAPLTTGSEMDLIRLSSLVRWVDLNTARIGKDRVEVILDIYEMSGRITGETKKLVKRLCALSRDEEQSRVPVRDVVSAMLTMDGVLDDDASQSRRLLGLMYDDASEGFDISGSGLPR